MARFLIIFFFYWQGLNNGYLINHIANVLMNKIRLLHSQNFNIQYRFNVPRMIKRYNKNYFVNKSYQYMTFQTKTKINEI